jgi:hypothetical protein
MIWRTHQSARSAVQGPAAGSGPECLSSKPPVAAQCNSAPSGHSTYPNRPRDPSGHPLGGVAWCLQERSGQDSRVTSTKWAVNEWQFWSIRTYHRTVNAAKPALRGLVVPGLETPETEGDEPAVPKR